MGVEKPIDAVLDELAQAGIQPTVTQTKHVKVKFRFGGRNHVYTCPLTPGCRRSILNCRADIRRLLRQAEEA